MNKVVPFLISLLAASGFLSAQTVLEDFESYAVGVQPANYAGSITILDGTTTPASPTSSQSAMFATAGTNHRWIWTGAADPVITVSFDMYSGSAVTEPQPLRFAFNRNSGGLVTGTNNLIRLAMRGDGTFDFEATAAESYTDNTFHHDTLMTIHIVFNSSDASIDNYYEGESVGANSIEVWKEIDGVITHVGEGQFQNGYASEPLVVFGFGTSSTYTSGDFVVDNLRWAPGAKAFIPNQLISTAELVASPRAIPAGESARLSFNLSEYPAGSTYGIVADKAVAFLGGTETGSAADSGYVDAVIDLPDQSEVTFTLFLYDAGGSILATDTATVVVFDFNKPQVFPHPSMINTQLQLDAMRAAVLNRPDSVTGKEWAAMLTQEWASLDYQPTSQAIVYVTGSGSNPSEDAFRKDSQAARSHALQWVVTGDPAHRDKAIEILNAYGRNFIEVQMEGGGYGNQIRLESAWALPVWTSAADIIRYHDGGSANWAEADMAQFAGMLLTLFKEAYLASLATSTRDYASIGAGYHNWSVSGSLARMAYGAWIDDADIFEQAYDHLLFILDDFSLPTGEINETCRDTIHPQYSIVCFTDAAELAHNLGYDGLYTATFDGQATPRLAVILEYFSKMMLGITNDPCSGIDYLGEYSRFDNYEVPYNHYMNRVGAAYLPTFKDMVENHWRNNPGADDHFMLWSRMTNGMESSGLQYWDAYFTLDGNVDTQGWMHWINVSYAPWIYNYSLNKWIYMPEELITDFGSWAYIPR